MHKTLLIIGSVWPEPKSSAAGSRMLQLIETFQNDNYTITFASSSVKGVNAFNLKAIGIDEKSIQLNNSSFDTFIKELNPMLVLFDRFMMEEQFGWRVTEHCPNALRILDTEDLHGLRKGRQQALKQKECFNNTHLLNDVTKRELASIYRSDLSLIISEYEMQLLQNDFRVDSTLLCYLPFMLKTPDESTKIKIPKFKARQHFISIGNFLHQPNHHAVIYLKEVIWPKIKTKLPNAELHIYGAYVSQKISQLNNHKEGFLVKGFAPDVNQVMEQARLCLAPLRFGAGLKGKLVDAMQNGTPCVMSSIAAEGMFGELSPNGYCEDDPVEFANKAISLYEDQSSWETMQQKGYEILRQRFSKKEQQQKLLQSVHSISKNLRANRQNNIVGQLLHHHSLQSTKYMSKWIEEKNKS